MAVYQNLAVIAGFAFVYSAVASRLERTPVSGPLVFVIFGFVVGPSGLGFIDLAMVVTSASRNMPATIRVTVDLPRMPLT